MHYLGQFTSIELLDGLATALLSAAACCRARSFGAHHTGSLVLGCICGLIGPVLRETVLHGSAGSRMAICAMPDDALLGALAAICAIAIMRGHTSRLFFWLDGASMGMAGCLSAILSFPELGLAGALALGLASGLLPGITRDVALGDIAMAVEKSWYATAAAIGCLLSIGLVLMPTFVDLPKIILERLAPVAVVAGTCGVLCLHWWKSEDINNF